jgi:hypothetical protein
MDVMTTWQAPTARAPYLGGTRLADRELNAGR